MSAKRPVEVTFKTGTEQAVSHFLGIDGRHNIAKKTRQGQNNKDDPTGTQTYGGKRERTLCTRRLWATGLGPSDGKSCCGQATKLEQPTAFSAITQT